MRSTSYSEGTIIQFAKFCLVGVLNTGIHYGVFLALFRLLDVYYLVSSTIGYCCGSLNSFVWNKMWTFQARGTRHSTAFLKFAIVNGLSLLINVVSMKMFVAGIGLRPEFAQVLTIGLAVMVNFFGYKLWAFRKKVILSSQKTRFLNQSAYNGEYSGQSRHGEI